MTFLFAIARTAAQDSSALDLGAPQFIFIVVLFFAVIGFQRGWRRGLVTLGFYLGVLLILVLGGGEGIASFFLKVLPKVLQVMVGQTPQDLPDPNAGQILFIKLITLVVAIILGYVVSNKAFPQKPSTPHERLLGILPSIIGGYALVIYVSNKLVPSANLLTVRNVDQNSAGSSLGIIILVAVMVVIAAVIAFNAKKPPAKK
jgi:hypothetical protein